MFVPQTAHFGPRTYSSNAPTTARRPKTLNNKENSHALPAKTPSRPGLGGKDALLLGADAGGAKGGGAATVGRARTGLGVKTVERNAGVQARPAGGGGAGTQEANGKGKGKDKGELGDEIAPKRLFTNSKALPTSTSLSSLPSLPSRSHGLSTTKTPGPSRLLPLAVRTPAPAPRPRASDPSEPAPTPLPSATRQRRRSRLSGSSSQPALNAQAQTPLKLSGGSADGELKTPVQGRWDEGESIEMSELDQGGAEVKEGLEEVVEEEEDDGELEYMPEPVEPLPWEPPWEHPAVGPIFDTLARQPIDFVVWQDEPVALQEPELSIMEKEPMMMELDEEDFEHPVLRRKNPAPAAKANVRVLAQASSAVSAPKGVLARGGAVARPATSTTRPSANPSMGRPTSRQAVPCQMPTGFARAALRTVPANQRTVRPTTAVPGGKLKTAPLAKMEVSPEDQQLLDSLVPLQFAEDNFVLDLKL